MKFVYALFAGLLLMVSACQAKSEFAFEIIGNVSGLDDASYVDILSANTGERIENLSRAISSGELKIQGVVDSVDHYLVLFFDSKRVEIASKIMLIEPGMLRLDYVNGEFQFAGGVIYQSIIDPWMLTAEFRSLKSKLDKISLEVLAISDPREQSIFYSQKLRPVQFAIQDYVAASLREIFRENDDPLIKYLTVSEERHWQPYLVTKESWGYRKAAFKSLIELLPQHPGPKQQYAMLDLIDQRQATANSIAVGSTVRDFSSPDFSGRNIQLTDVLNDNKYTLVEFWSSWCGPCRAEISHLKKAYNSFHNKGFEIFSYTLDEDKEAWKLASEEEALPWLNVGDLKGFDSPIADMFGILGIPANYLVNSQGEIVAKQLRGEALDKKLGELLGK